MQALSEDSLFGNEAGPVHRRRILEGLAEAITRKGYSATTIADIVRHARVSKRTFYEHFRDKEECFLAAYEAAAGKTIEAIVSAVDPGMGWAEQIHAATRAYFSALESNAALARAFLLEIQAAGPRALKVRREVNQRFADLLRTLTDASREEHPELVPLSKEMATAIVGGINEVLLLYVEGGKASRLSELAETAAGLLQAVLQVKRRGSVQG